MLQLSLYGDGAPDLHDSRRRNKGRALIIHTAAAIGVHRSMDTLIG